MTSVQNPCKREWRLRTGDQIANNNLIIPDHRNAPAFQNQDYSSTITTEDIKPEINNSIMNP